MEQVVANYPVINTILTVIAIVVSSLTLVGGLAAIVGDFCNDSWKESTTPYM